jgi:hypothetical protein
MNVIRGNEHEAHIRDTAHVLKAVDVFEHIVSVVWLPLIRLFEEFQFHRASTLMTDTAELKPNIDSALT